MSPETKEVLEMLSGWVLNEQRTYRDSGFEVIDEIFDSFVDKIDSLLNPQPSNPVVEELSSLRDYFSDKLKDVANDSFVSPSAKLTLETVIEVINKRISEHERSSSINP